MTQKTFNKKQKIQEAQYAYPYHYIPMWGNGRFSQVHYWPWGFRYLGGIQVVLDQLKQLSFNSLIDIGCGDGRFLREVYQQYPGKTLLGIDYSERAIQISRLMNPDLDYRCTDIINNPINKRFDLATMIEVLEHILPDDLGQFLQAAAKLINNQGWLILTVPHENKKLSDKHHQHFNSQKLCNTLEQYFKDFSFIPFDTKSKMFQLLHRIIGGNGDHFIITNSWLLSWFYRLYKNRYLYTRNESRCMRIAVICRKR